MRSFLALLLALTFVNASLGGCGHASAQSKRAMHGIAPTGHCERSGGGDLSGGSDGLCDHGELNDVGAMPRIALENDLRIQRPANGFVQSVFQCDYSPLADFKHWRQEYAEPTLCPMVLCRGSCAYRESRCTVTADGGVSQCPSAWMSESMYESGLSGCESSQ